VSSLRRWRSSLMELADLPVKVAFFACQQQPVWNQDCPLRIVVPRWTIHPLRKKIFPRTFTKLGKRWKRRKPKETFCLCGFQGQNVTCKWATAILCTPSMRASLKQNSSKSFPKHLSSWGLLLGTRNSKGLPKAFPCFWSAWSTYRRVSGQHVVRWSFIIQRKQPYRTNGWVSRLNHNTILRLYILHNFWKGLQRLSQWL